MLNTSLSFSSAFLSFRICAKILFLFRKFYQNENFMEHFPVVTFFIIIMDRISEITGKVFIKYFAVMKIHYNAKIAFSLSEIIQPSEEFEWIWGNDIITPKNGLYIRQLFQFRLFCSINMCLLLYVRHFIQKKLTMNFKFNIYPYLFLWYLNHINTKRNNFPFSTFI